MSQLNSSQVFILKALSGKGGTMTREQLNKFAADKGIALSGNTLGPVKADAVDNHPESLTAAGYVRPCCDEDGNRWFEITSKGEKAASLWKTRERTAEEEKVPGKVLDPIVKRMHKTRTYGFELYTHADLQEIRGQLPEQYHGVGLESLRLQICNRRKQGAYADPLEKERANMRKLSGLLAKYGLSLDDESQVRMQRLIKKNG